MTERTAYTEEQRATALTRYVQEGAAATSKALGIPAGTIASWAHRAGVATMQRKNTDAIRQASEQRLIGWEDRRSRLLEQWGGIAEVATESVFDLLEEGDTRAAKDVATVAAIATDKANLLAGGTTSRVAIDVSSHQLAEQGRGRLLELHPPTGTDG